jgi:hypothetical protein
MVSSVADPCPLSHADKPRTLMAFCLLDAITDSKCLGVVRCAASTPARCLAPAAVACGVRAVEEALKGLVGLPWAGTRLG